MTYPNYELIEYICREKMEEMCLKIKYPIFKMDTFWQIWGSTALGFNANGGCAGQAMTPAYTTVVEMNWYIKENNNWVLSKDTLYAVFFGNEIAYMYINPSGEFYHDLEHRCMKSQRESAKYLGGEDSQCLNEED